MRGGAVWKLIGFISRRSQVQILPPLLFHTWWKIQARKKVNIILLISKELAHKLNKEYGVKFGEGGISTSKTKHKKYYICECQKNMIALEKATK